jgi:hypothetical protein
MVSFDEEFIQPVGEALEACPDVTVGDVVEMIHARQRELEQEPECDT